MINLLASSGVQDLLDKFLSIALPVFISIGIVVGILTLIYAAVNGMFAKDGNARKENRSWILGILICCVIVVLASSIIYALKSTFV